MCSFLSNVFLFVKVNCHSLPQSCNFSGVITSTNHGKTILLHEGYKYFRRSYVSKTTNKVRWMCSAHSSFKCRAKIHTINNVIILFDNTHHHPPEIMESRRGLLLEVGYMS